MATVAAELTTPRRAPRGAPAALAVLGACLLAGCVTTDDKVDPAAPPPPPKDVTPCQVLATWEPQVFWAPDPVHNGTPSPTLVGQVYLFGPDVGFPMMGDGSLVVDLYEGSPPPGTPATPLEEWRIDPTSLRKYARHDYIGWGYTLGLPWQTYRPDLCHVQMRVRYESGKPGTLPLFTNPTPLTLNPAPDAACPIITTSAKVKS
jgi:hypothetical protein